MAHRHVRRDSPSSPSFETGNRLDTLDPHLRCCALCIAVGTIGGKCVAKMTPSVLWPWRGRSSVDESRLGDRGGFLV